MRCASGVSHKYGQVSKLAAACFLSKSNCISANMETGMSKKAARERKTFLFMNNPQFRIKKWYTDQHGFTYVF
jgi:hypothetical protein